MEVVQEKRDTVPLHLAALVVEIKVVVLDLGVIQHLNLLGKGNSHGSLVSLLVDEVDYQLWSVKLLLGVKMLME